jgi:hypothetical protein
VSRPYQIFHDKMKKELTIKVHLATILIAINVWVYVLYSAATVDNSTINHIVTLYIASLSSFYIYLFKNNTLTYITSSKSVTILLSASALVVMLFFPRLTEQISSDQLYYVKSAVIHSLTVFGLADLYLDLPTNISYATMLWAFNIVLLVSTITLWWLAKRLKLKLWQRIILTFILLIIFRTILTQLAAGSRYTHPPMHLFPIWVTHTIFGFTDLSARLPALLTLIINVYLINNILTYFEVDKLRKILPILAIITTPLFLYVATLTEASVYGFTGTLVFYISLIRSEPGQIDRRIYLYTSILLILTLMRLNNIGYLVLYLIYIATCNTSQGWNRKTSKIYIKSLAIAASAVPYLIITLIRGTPASQTNSISNSDIQVLSGTLYEITHNLYNMITSVISPLWLIALLGLTLIPTAKHKRINFFVVIAFIIQLTMFASVKPELYSMTRYKAEYLLPFSVIGFIILINLISKRFVKIEGRYQYPWIISVGFASIIITNVVLWQGYPEKYLDKMAGTFLQRKSELIWDYKKAFESIDLLSNSKSTLIAGQTYGPILGIYAGLTYDDILNLSNIQENYLKRNPNDWLNYDYETIANEPSIRFVVITDILNRSELENSLRENDWTEVYQGSEHLSKVYVFKRGANDT